jgi:hypothetical protein
MGGRKTARRTATSFDRPHEDHIVPLACGGADAVYNLQSQTIAVGKAKDRWERRGCFR